MTFGFGNRRSNQNWTIFLFLMSKYLLEIKNRFFLLILTWISTLFISYFYKETLLFVLIEPQTFKYLAFFYFIFTDVTEIFSVYIKLTMFLSLQFAYVYIIMHIFLFLSPAFYKFEFIYTKSILKTFILGWLLSIILTVFVLIPTSWEFFLSFQKFSTNHSFNLYFEAKINEYFLFYLSFYYLCGFYCQFFILLLLLLNSTKINFKRIKKFRKIFYYCFIFFATLISPPEIFIQIFITMLAVFGYEILILIFLIKNNFLIN